MSADLGNYRVIYGECPSFSSFSGCMMWVLSGLLALVLLLGCDKPEYPPNKRPTLYTTISADGLMVATLSEIGMKKPLLRFIRLDDDKGWQELPVPPYTNSIRFGLTGYELLLTNYIGEARIADLSKWDLAAPENGPQRIYRADSLGFPIEVVPGEYLVRICIPRGKTPDGKDYCRTFWDLVKKKELAHRYDSDRILSYRQPNIVEGEGFFWTTVRGDRREGEVHPRVRGFSFPNGKLPHFETSHLGEDTGSVKCDYRADRCLRNYIKNFGKKEPGPFVYDIEILLGQSRCQPLGTEGYSDGFWLTPSGNAAVMSLATGYDQPRHVVVMHFTPGQCEPTSIQHLHF